MITEKQRQKRRNYLGSSDAAAIVGVDPYRSADDVYASKTLEMPDQELSDAARIGNYFESGVLDWFEDETGLKLIRNQFRVHKNRIMAANIDSIVKGKKELVEAKTAGMLGYFNKTRRAKWGENGTDQIPEHYIVQCQHQLAVTGYEIAWVPVYLGGIGFVLYKITRNQELIGLIEKLEVKFWKEIKNERNDHKRRDSLCTDRR